MEDEELEAFLEESENRSETIREALRVYRFQQDGVPDPRLSERQRVGYEWLRETAEGGGRVSLDVVETTLAQLLSVKKALVRQLVVKPLARLGYVRVVPRMESVVVVVRPPDAVDVPSGTAETDGPSSVSERMDDLVEPDVVGGADA